MTFFPEFEKKFPISFFFLEFSFSPHTHKLHGENLLSLHLEFSFNIMAIVCVIVYKSVFKLTENAVIVCLEKFPNLVVYRANFPS